MEVRLANSERAEELAILGFLTSEVAVSEAKTRHLMEKILKILELDLACARGAHAQWIDSACPVFSEDHEKKYYQDRENLSVDIEGIRHPLLLEPSLRSLSSISVSDAEGSKLLNTRDGSLGSENLIKGDSPVPLDIRLGMP